MGDWNWMPGGYEAAPMTEETSILISYPSWSVEGCVLKLLGGLRASKEKQGPHLERPHRKQGFVQAYTGTGQ